MKKEYEIIGYNLLKADKSNERGKLYTYKCCNKDKCPIFKKNKCIHTGMFSTCKYGKCSLTESGSYEHKVSNNIHQLIVYN